MPIYTEPRHSGEHIHFEINRDYSREEVTLAAGNLKAGTVLALDANKDYVQVAPAATDSTATAVAVLKDATDASAGPALCVVSRRGTVVKADELEWPADATAAQIEAGLADLLAADIIAR